MICPVDIIWWQKKKKINKYLLIVENQMRMPTEQLSQIPVVALSPNLATAEQNTWWSKSSWGSAPSSPQKSLTVNCTTSNNSMSASYHGSSAVIQNTTR